MAEQNTEKDTFVAVNEAGKVVTYDILFTFESQETGKNYIVYTDRTKDKDGDVKVFASTFDPKGDDPDLLPIRTEEEWNLLETILETMQEEIKRKLQP